MKAETFEEILASCREQRRLRETFAPPKPFIDPCYLPSEEDRKFDEDCELADQLDKMGRPL